MRPVVCDTVNLSISSVLWSNGHISYRAVVADNVFWLVELGEDVLREYLPELDTHLVWVSEKLVSTN